jgi:hypothetical protein
MGKKDATDPETPEHPPTDGELVTLLGPAHAALEALVTHAPGRTSEWRKYTKRSPWVLRVSQGRKPVMYVQPEAGALKATVLLGPRAVEAALSGRVSKPLQPAIRAAKVYPEGRPVSVQPEYADCVKAAKASGRPLKDVIREALRAYENLLGRSSVKPVRLAAAQRYFDLSLARALGLGDKEKGRALADLVRTVERLEAADFSCGYYHYVHAQVEGHRGDLRRSYEEAVTARELGLPTEKIFRDNDNQIVFCRDALVGTLPAADRDAFSAAHASWTKKWGWKDARTPGWKQE